MYLNDPEKRRVAAQKVIVGDDEKYRILEEAHSDFGKGHMGEKKTSE